MPKKTKADEKFEAANKANAAFNQAIANGSQQFGLVWLYANLDAKQAVSAFANTEDPIIRAVIVTSIEATLKNVPRQEITP